MHTIFRRFIDDLASASVSSDFRDLMADAASAMDLPCFAYLELPQRYGGRPRLISTYPAKWTSHYLHMGYECIDPVISQALEAPEPFRWGLDSPLRPTSSAHRTLFSEAAAFGIRVGFTVPIHDGHSPVAALTFAANEKWPHFEKSIESHGRVLQLMAMCFHAHLRRALAEDREIYGIHLSPREFECLEWASRGKSAWEVGCILGISRNTVAHYLENAKEKLGVRTVVQAVGLLAAASKGKRK